MIPTLAVGCEAKVFSQIKFRRYSRWPLGSGMCWTGDRHFPPQPFVFPLQQLRIRKERFHFDFSYVFGPRVKILTNRDRASDAPVKSA